jgi:hypothetical protein
MLDKHVKVHYFCCLSVDMVSLVGAQYYRCQNTCRQYFAFWQKNANIVDEYSILLKNANIVDEYSILLKIANITDEYSILAKIANIADEYSILSVFSSHMRILEHVIKYYRCQNIVGHHGNI